VTIFFASDIHGSELCWRKFVNAAGFYGADLLLLGGDFTGKLVIPVVTQPGGGYRARFMGKVHELEVTDLASFESRVSDMGFYPTRVSPDELADLEARPEAVTSLFESLMKERLVRWIEWARHRLAGTPVTILTAPANDDPFSIDQVIADQGGETFRNVEGAVVEICPGHEMISSGWTNPTPWETPREFPEEEIAAHIDVMASKLADPATAIFNLHPPPFASQLDTAPQLDSNLRVVTSGGAAVMVPVGSTAVREAIERYQPLLSLHGHIHESAGRVLIGRTTAINPGSEYGEGILRGALVTIGRGRIQRYQATTG
jgi:Icc-related predicted phosphoesterase